MRSACAGRLAVHQRTACAVAAALALLAAVVVIVTGFMLVYDVPLRVWGRREKGLLSAGRLFSISPDGRSLLFSRARGKRSQIARIDLLEGGETVMMSSADYLANPAWSPNGRSFAYTRETGKCGHVWLAPSTGEAGHQITSGSSYDSDPLFLPDGRTIWFTRVARGVSGAEGTVYVTDVTGTGARPLSTENALLGGQAAVTRGSQAIYYLGREGYDFRRDVALDEIWRMEPNGTNPVRVGLGSQPAVSPDGGEVAFVAGDSGTELWVMHADGTGRRKVYRSRSGIRCPAFHPDGRRVFFVEDGNHGAAVVCVALSGGGYRRIVRLF